MTSRRGVSLIELLIAITVVGFLSLAMTRLLTTNARAAASNDAARDARAVSRSALNLLESELRAVEPNAVVGPTDNMTLTVRTPYAIGLICSLASGTTIALLPSSDLPSSLVVGGRAGFAWRDATGVYRYRATTALSNGSSSTCTGAGIAPITGGRVVTTDAPIGGTPPAGTIAYLFREITYSLQASTSAPGKLGLFRTAGASGVPEELSAPFGPTARFRWYILNDPIVQDTLPTDLADLRGVQFVLPGESRRNLQSTGLPATTPFSTSIFFQNRPN